MSLALARHDPFHYIGNLLIDFLHSSTRLLEQPGCWQLPLLCDARLGVNGEKRSNTGAIAISLRLNANAMKQDYPLGFLGRCCALDLWSSLRTVCHGDDCDTVADRYCPGGCCLPFENVEWLLKLDAAARTIAAMVTEAV